MLRLPWAVAAARSYCLRSFSTSIPPPNDKLEEILSGIDANGEYVSDHPPQGPTGVLPPGGAPQLAPGQAQGGHSLPSPKEERIYHLHVFASRNNTILTFTNAVGNPRAHVSAGSCGFKKVQRSGYEGGYQCAVKMFNIVAKEIENQHMVMKLEVLFKGFGNGREAFYRALMTTEGDKIRNVVSRLTDTTPLKIGGGTRARKARRL